MKKITLVLLACLFVFSGFSQSIEKYNLYNNDIDHLQNILYTSHPGTFKYMERDAMDSLFASMKFENNENASTLELEKRVRVILNKVGCIHTSIKNTQFNFNDAIIPFNVFAKDNSLWIKDDWADSTSMLKGYQILSINGNTSKEMINALQNFRAADGYNMTFKYQLLNNGSWFNKKYQYYFDTTSIKSYTLVSPDLDTIVLERNNIIPEKKAIVKKDDHVIHIGNDLVLTFDSVHQIAILKVKSFGSIFPVIGTVINKIRYKKAMKLIEQSGYKNLVIDLRNNLGGSGPAGNAFLSFLVDEKHHYFATRNKGKILRYATPLSKFGVGFNFLMGNVFAQRMPTFKLRKSKSFVRKGKKYHFEGNLYVITNGLTVSTAAIVASTLKYKSDAIMIGEESGSGAASMNGYFYPKVKLPYSNIKMQIPQYDIDLNLMEDIGSGVQPDQPIIYTLEDVLNGKDLEMDAIINRSSVTVVRQLAIK